MREARKEPEGQGIRRAVWRIRDILVRSGSADPCKVHIHVHHFSYNFCLTIKGSGSRVATLTNGSGSRRPKKHMDPDPRHCRSCGRNEVRRDKEFGSEILSFYGSEIDFSCCQKSAQAEGHTANEKYVYITCTLFVCREASGGG
jgi:hypothetical protein